MNIDKLLRKYNNSYVVKPNSDGSSIGMSIINDNPSKNVLQQSIDKCNEVSNDIIIEEYIIGRELTVSLIDGIALPIVEIFPKGNFYDYDSKYKDKGSSYQVPAMINDNISRKLAEDSIKLYDKIGCRHYARIDYLLDGDKYYLLEINTLPGLTSTSLLPKSAAKTGLDYSTLIDKIIKIALKK